jgi:dUTPase-like protein
MITDQRMFCKRVDVRWMSDDITQRIAYVKDMYIALVQEAGEALNETTWKPWATEAVPAIHTLELITELTDIWCFVMNMWFAAMPDATPEQIAEALFQSHHTKVKVNHQRQNEGYDGTNKCSGCGRAFDDSSVRCVPASNQIPGFCMASGSPERQA